MPAKKTAPSTGLTRIDPEKVKAEGLTIVSGVEARVQGLTITDSDDYLSADALLGFIQNARKTWKGKIEPAIRPIRQGLDALYELNRSMDRPLELAEAHVKRLMKDFKLEEARQLQAEKDERDRLEREKLREAEERRRAAEQAATPQAKGRLLAQADRLEEVAQAIAEQPTNTATAGSHSSDRRRKKVRIISHGALLKGILDGYVPGDVVEVNQTRLNAYFKDDPEGMQAWPGVEVYDDIDIIGR